MTIAVMALIISLMASIVGSSFITLQRGSNEQAVGFYAITTYVISLVALLVGLAIALPSI